MKVIGTFFSVFALVALFAPSAGAKELRFYVDCSIDDPKSDKMPAEVSSWKVVKISNRVVNPKDDQPKWQDSYALEVHLKGKKATEVYRFEGMGGDEGYIEYEVVASERDSKRIGVSAVYVNDRFQGANLVNNDGSGFATCK